MTSFLHLLLLGVAISLMVCLLVRPIVMLRLFLFWPDIVGRMRTPRDRRAYQPNIFWECAQGAWWVVLLVAIVYALFVRFG